MNPFLNARKLGFLGAGNMAQAIINGLVESGFPAKNIMVSNRSFGKLEKIQGQHHEIVTTQNNEDLLDFCDILIVAVKPQDLFSAIEPLASGIDEDLLIISLAAGIQLRQLEKCIHQARWVRAIPNTPTFIRKGVTGFLSNQDDDSTSATAYSLFEPLGRVFEVEDEDQLETLMVGTSSGVGFVFEMMSYWQEWLEEHDFTPEEAQAMTIDTFVGASLLAQKSPETIVELQNKVVSKKGVTAAGLESMRELEIERALRISFEKSCLRNKELAHKMK